VQADLLATMGEVYAALGLSTEWREVLENERSLRADFSGTDNGEYADILLRLSEAEDLSGNYDLSLQHAKEGLAISRRLADRLSEAAGHVRVGRILHLQGEYEGADAGYRNALAIYEREYGYDSLEVAAVNSHLASLLIHQEQYDGALTLLENVLAIRAKFIPGDNPENPGALLAMGLVLNNLQRNDEAITVYEQAFAMNERLFGPDNSYNLYIVSGLAKVSLERGDFDTAVMRYKDVIRLVARYMPESANLGRANANLGKAYLRSGRYDLALPAYRDALTNLQQHIPDHWLVGEVRWRLGRCIAEAGDYAAAEPLILAGIETLTSHWGKEHDATREAYTAAVHLYDAWSKPETAAEYR
jgi:tetratricopeptide (TPR) repeat protein